MVDTTAGELVALRAASRKSSKLSVLGEGSMELELLRERKASKQSTRSMAESEHAAPTKDDIAKAERKISDYSDGFLSDLKVPVEAVETASEEDSAGSATTDQQWNLSRTYAVTLYSSELCSDLEKSSAAKAKARTYAVNLPKDAAFSPSSESTPPPPRGAAAAARRRSHDFNSGGMPKFHVWTNSEMLNVKTPEIASQKGDDKAFIRVAFKPNSKPRRSREFVYIEDAESKVPLECLGFDLEYI
jgi:hypothetical protein